MARIDKIKQALRGLEPEDKIQMHNYMCSEGNSEKEGDEIYENDEEFFNMFYANDVFGAVQRAFYGDYRPMDDYVMFNGDANFDSIETSRLDRWIDDDAIAKFLDENEQYLDNLDIEDEELNEVSEDRYYEMLEVLPPYYFNTLNGKKVSGGFAVSEANTHTKTPIGFRATYNGFYKVGEKYFEIGDVYFVYADEMGEPNGEGSRSVEAMTLDPDAFAKGGGVRKVNGREYSSGRNWTNDHRHHNKSEDYEVPQADRKRQYSGGGSTDKQNTYVVDVHTEIGEDSYTIDATSGQNAFEEAKHLFKKENPQFKGEILCSMRDKFAEGGGVRKVNGREYSLGRNWTNDHRHHNKSEDYEVPQADRKRQYAKGGGVRRDFFTGREYSLGRNWTNDHRHHNKSEDYEVPQADRKRQYGTGGTIKIGSFAPISEAEAILMKEDFKENFSSNIERYTKHLNKIHDSKLRVIDVKKVIDFADKSDSKKFGTGGTMDSSTFKKGGFTPKEPIAFENSNLYFNGYGVDINGNKVVRVSFPNSRAFSIQTNGTLPKTNNAYGTIGFDEAEINSYVKSYGSPAQKKKLKIYKK
jgi:hypothetical protein